MDILPDNRLIIVSNREPYSSSRRHQLTVGGLVSALDPLMKAAQGVWIASGSREELKGKTTRFPVPPADPSYTLRLLPLSPAVIEGYFKGFSNTFFFPLCPTTPHR